MRVERDANGMGRDYCCSVSVYSYEEEAGNSGEMWERLRERNGKRQWECVGYAQRNTGGTCLQIKSPGIRTHNTPLVIS